MVCWVCPFYLFSIISFFFADAHYPISRCIILELYTTKPIFQGSDELNQLEIIYGLLGTPTEAEWPSVKELPWYELVKPKEEIGSRFRTSFAKLVFLLASAKRGLPISASRLEAVLTMIKGGFLQLLWTSSKAFYFTTLPNGF